VVGTCEYGNEISGSVKFGEILDQLQNQLASQEGLCSMEQVSKSTNILTEYFKHTAHSPFFLFKMPFVS
jgi:hypothetical protein